jgi:Ni/Fe-hydrogenase 1 B-type cytochrome subunit
MKEMADIAPARHPTSFRIAHFVFLTAIMLLIITGLYIHFPFLDNGGGFLMILMRGIHLFSAFTFTATIIFRVIFMFAGKDRDWAAFLPNWNDVLLLPQIVTHYMHFGAMPRLTKKYNPLQMMVYAAIFLLALFQILSGFAMMYPDGWLAWFNYGVFGTEYNTRIAHYIIMWLFVMFISVHLYLGIRDAFDEMREMHLVPESSEKKAEEAAR